MKDRSAAKFGKPRRATTPIERYRAAERQRLYRAKLATLPQVRAFLD